jgi:hypothetical protein
MGLRQLCFWVLSLLLLWAPCTSASVAFANYGDMLTRTTGLPAFGALTQMCWTYNVSAVSGGFNWVVFGIGGTSDWSVHMSINVDTTNVLQVEASIAGGASNLTSTSPPITTWHHLAWTFNGTTTMTGYMNASALSNPVTGITGTATWYQEAMGGYPPNANYQSFTHLGGCKEWTAALSAAEIAAEMLYITPVRTLNLVSYTPLRTISDIKDYVNGVTWTIGGSPATATDPSYVGGVTPGNGFLAW